MFDKFTIRMHKLGNGVFYLTLCVKRCYNDLVYIFVSFFSVYVQWVMGKKRDRSKERKKKKHTIDHSDDEQHSSTHKRKDKDR